MRKSYHEENGEKVFRYSIRKCHFGAASVAVAALMFFANGAVKADTLPVSSATEPKSVTEGLSTGLKNNIESKAATEPKAATEGVLTGLKDNVETKVQTTELQEKVSALQSEVNRIRANEKQKAQIEQAEKLIKEVNDLQASKTATQKEVDAKVKEIKSLTFILKSMKAEETVKPKKNQDSRNGKKMVKGTGFRMGEGTPGSTPSTPQPEGNVIARGEDGVPWELYGNGYLLFKPEVGKDTLTNNSGKSAWKINYGAQIKHVGFADKVYAPKNSESLFAEITLNADSTKYTNFNPLTFDTIHLDTSKVTNMSNMFDGLGKLTNLDLTHFDTRNVTNMSRMFSFMFNLTNLDLTHFNTSNVTNMSGMFSHTEKLTNLDLTHFDTRNVTDMSRMFSFSKLTNLDLTHFNTSNVTDMSVMFGFMSRLANLDVTHFNTSNVTNMSGMFRGMSITNLDLTHFKTSNVTNMAAMFSESSNLTNLDLTHFNTSNVTNMSGMFNQLNNLTNLDVTHFNTSKVTDMSEMFSGMSNLTNLDVTHFDTSNVTNMSDMFGDMSNLTNLDVTHFDTSKVTDMSFMFDGMSNLTNLDLTHFDTSNVTDMEDMFGGAGKLKELKLGDKFKADGIRTIPTTHSYGNQYTDKWHKVEDKEHTYTVSDWADAYAGNSTATAGTWVREVSNATLTFLADEATNAKVKTPVTPTLVGDKENLTKDAKVDKAKLEGAIHQLDELIIKESAKLDAETAKEANDLLADAKKVFANADASQAEVDAMVKRLEEFKLNQASVATDDQAANNVANASNGETSEDAADAKLAANVSKRNSQKELPNTGTSISGTVLPAIAALLLGVGVFATKKKEDE